MKKNLSKKAVKEILDKKTGAYNTLEEVLKSIENTNPRDELAIALIGDLLSNLKNEIFDFHRKMHRM